MVNIHYSRAETITIRGCASDFPCMKDLSAKHPQLFYLNYDVSAQKLKQTHPIQEILNYLFGTE